MSHIYVRKITGSRYSFAGREWWYDFGPEINALNNDAVKKFVAKKQTAFSTLVKSWNDELNTEWVCRIFWAAKMVLTSSLMLQNLEYARSKNLRVCIPYLQYYSLLYSLKALVVVLPSQPWNKGGLIEITHKKTINVACAEIAKLDTKWCGHAGNSSSIKEQILSLKAFREFISYRAPSSAGSLDKYEIDAFPLCKISVELAQMVSELLEESLAKHLSKGYSPRLLEEDLRNVFTTEIENENFLDKEDLYRIGYLFRKYPMPANILHIMSEGHVEDFFGSWCGVDQSGDMFDPDENWGILFDVP